MGAHRRPDGRDREGDRPGPRPGIAKTRLSDAARAARRRDRRPRPWSSAAGSPGCAPRSAWPTSASACYLVEREADGSAAGSARFGPMFPHDAGRPRADRPPDRRDRQAARRSPCFTNAELVGKSGSFGNYIAEVTGQQARRRTESSPARGRLDRRRHRLRHLPAGGGRVRLRHRGRRHAAGVQGAGRRAPRDALTYQGRPVALGRLHLLRRQPAGRAATSTARSSAARRRCTPRSRSRSSTRRCSSTTCTATSGPTASTSCMYTESRKRGSVYMKFPDDTPPTVTQTPDRRLAVTVDGPADRRRAS